MIPTGDFAQPAEDSLSDTHRKLAKSKRATDQAGDSLLQVEDLGIFGSAEIHPIIFEECYVRDSEQRFVQLVKANPDLLTE